MLATFVGALLLFALARFGGIPVPTSPLGWGGFVAFAALLVCELFIALSSLLLSVRAFTRLRETYRPCLRQATNAPFVGWALIDLAALPSFALVPAVVQVRE